MDTQTDSLSQFSGFTQIKSDITAPREFKLDMEFSKLTIMAGMNDTGKSFMNKLMWSAVFFFNLKLIEVSTGIKDESKTDEEMFQFILDKTFDDQNIDGTIQFYSRDDLLKAAFFSFKYTVEKGKVVELQFDYPENPQPSGMPVYLSKDTREFSAIERYTKFKKLSNIENIESFEALEKLTDFYKIYDVFAFENLIGKFTKLEDVVTMMNAVDPKLLEDFNLKDIFVDKDDGIVKFYDLKGNKRNASTLGQGAQSFIMMILAGV